MGQGKDRYGSHRHSRELVVAPVVMMAVKGRGATPTGQIEGVETAIRPGDRAAHTDAEPRWGSTH